MRRRVVAALNAGMKQVEAVRVFGVSRGALNNWLRAWRDGNVHMADTMAFTINGPTCDSSDTLPGLVELPTDIRPGDYLEFGNIGAYSLSGRTDFNGYHSDQIVTITSESELPPSLPE